MFEKLHSPGYDLYEISLNEWIFNVKGGDLFTGSLSEVVRYMVTHYLFTPDNIEDAVRDMWSNGDDSVHFGMYRTHIFTFKRGERKTA